MTRPEPLWVSILGAIMVPPTVIVWWMVAVRAYEWLKKVGG